MDLSMDSLHLKHPLVLFGSEGSALTLFILSPEIIMLSDSHRSTTMTKSHFLALCVDVPLNTHSFIPYKGSILFNPFTSE